MSRALSCCCEVKPRNGSSGSDEGLRGVERAEQMGDTYLIGLRTAPASEADEIIAAHPQAAIAWVQPPHPLHPERPFSRRSGWVRTSRTEAARGAAA
jgi:hypothetical protein